MLAPPRLIGMMKERIIPMKLIKRALAVALVALLSLPVLPARTGGQPLSDSKASAKQAKPHKIAHDLDELIDGEDSAPGTNNLHRVIIQPGEFTSPASVADKLAKHGGHAKNHFQALNLVSAELPLSRIRQLADDDEIDYIS